MCAECTIIACRTMEDCRAYFKLTSFCVLVYASAHVSSTYIYLVVLQADASTAVVSSNDSSGEDSTSPDDPWGLGLTRLGMGIGHGKEPRMKWSKLEVIRIR
jgi:hypothetical protein